MTSSDIDGANAVAVTYDSDGFVTAAGAMTLSRGTTGLLKSSTLGGITDTFSYSAYGELSGHAVTGGAASYTATRDTAGRVDTKTETVGGISHSERYTYDAAGRLWQVFVDDASTPLREWTYDANGNRTDGTYDAQDRQLTHAGASFTYGPNGDLTKKTDAVTHAETLFSYDAQGNLRTVTRPAPLAPIEYVIDGQNRRIGKKVGGSLAQGFLYGGTRIIAELDASGAVATRFVYATGSHAPDFMLKGAATYRIVKDHLGSPRLIVDASTGAIAQRLDYDEWGNVTSDTNPGFQPFGFAGGLWDRDTNLARFGARDYDATTGRWTSKDASRFLGGVNFYAYCYDTPVNCIDPTGRRGVAPTPGVGLGAIGLGAAFGPYVAVGVTGFVLGALAADALFDYTHPQPEPGGPGLEPGGAPGSGPGGGGADGGGGDGGSGGGGNRYPQCAGLSEAEGTRCCRTVTRYDGSGGLSGGPAMCGGDPYRRSGKSPRDMFHDCMDDNGYPYFP